MNLMLNSVMAEESSAYVMDSAESVAIVIEEFTGLDIIRRDTYAKLHDSVAKAGTFDAATELLDKAEEKFIKNNFSAEQIDAERTKKDGKIKKSKFLPDDYQSAKSVLLGALRQGIPLFNEDGEALGKSALSKAQSEGKKTASEKIAAQLESILKIIRKEDAATQAELIAAVSATVDGWIPATATVAIAE